ncbi:MAG: PACE efflux transporter [Paracoccaceae bacterium]|nr:PACE efflux transporter [Paracoccaceae bacterium]
MTPFTRRLLYVLSFEAIGVLIVTLGLRLMSGSGVDQTAPLAIACSLVAVAWNFAFNTAFEAWETRQVRRGRSLLRRAVHALGVEGGLLALLAPLIAWWLDLTLWQAVLYDFTLSLFFLGYTFVFNLGFDLVLGLPKSAR